MTPRVRREGCGGDLTTGEGAGRRWERRAGGARGEAVRQW
jgi:hypothetical protein